MSLHIFSAASADIQEENSWMYLVWASVQNSEFCVIENRKKMALVHPWIVLEQCLDPLDPWEKFVPNGKTAQGQISSKIS